jgi:hypothetical protein
VNVRHESILVMVWVGFGGSDAPARLAARGLSP